TGSSQRDPTPRPARGRTLDRMADIRDARDSGLRKIRTSTAGLAIAAVAGSVALAGAAYASSATTSSNTGTGGVTGTTSTNGGDNSNGTDDGGGGFVGRTDQGPQA